MLKLAASCLCVFALAACSETVTGPPTVTEPTAQVITTVDVTIGCRGVEREIGVGEEGDETQNAIDVTVLDSKTSDGCEPTVSHP